MDPALLASLPTLPPEQQAQILQMIGEEPALRPPNGTIPNFENPGGHHGSGYGVVILGAVLATLAVSLRIYSRFLLKTFNTEDGLLISALGMFAGHLALSYKLSIFPGVETHQWNIQLKSIPPILYDIHNAMIIVAATSMLLKCAILLDWVRTFCPMRQRNYFFWISYILVGANIIYYVAAIIVETTICNPAKDVLGLLMDTGKCPIQMRLVTGIMNLISDLAILALPQNIIWRLHIWRGKKIGLALLFAVGVFGCICGAIRLYYIVKMVYSPDQIYTVSLAGLWSIGETAAGFLVIGIPSLAKITKSVPILVSFVSRIQSWIGLGNSGAQSDPRRGLPSWYRRRSRKGYNRTDGSECDEIELVTTRNVGGREQTERSITREARIERGIDLELSELRTV